MLYLVTMRNAAAWFSGFSAVAVLWSTATPSALAAEGGARQVQEGKASYYGKSEHGSQTASGERFNMYAMTAAHRTLRLGSTVLVRNLRNGKQVKVRINDRGPYVRGRIIDLSYAAAQAIDMVREGVVPVQVELLSTPDRGPPQRRAIVSQRCQSPSRSRCFAANTASAVSSARGACGKVPKISTAPCSPIKRALSTSSAAKAPSVRLNTTPSKGKPRLRHSETVSSVWLIVPRRERATISTEAPISAIRSPMV